MKKQLKYSKNGELLKRCIMHWKENLHLTEKLISPDISWLSCALCSEYLKDDCRGCPIANYTGRDACKGTPYTDIEDLEDTIIMYTQTDLKNWRKLISLCREELELLETLLLEEVSWK